MRKRYMLSGILGLSAFVYSSNLVMIEESENAALKTQAAVAFAKPQKKQQETVVAPQIQQEEVMAVPEPSQPVRKVKKRSSKQSVAAAKQETALPLQQASPEKKVSPAAHVQKQVVVVPEEAVPKAPAMVPAKRVRQQPVAAPSPVNPKQSVASPEQMMPLEPVADRAPPSPEQSVAAPEQMMPLEPVAAPAATVKEQSVANPVSVQKKSQKVSRSVAPKKVKKTAERASVAPKLEVQSQATSPAQVAMATAEMVAEDKKRSSSTVPAQAEVITTPTAPIVKDNDNIFYGLEYLIMTTSEGGLSYGRENTAGVNKCYDAGFEWNSGFRLGMGYNMGHDRWDLQVAWTWLLTRGNHTKSDTVNQLYVMNAAPAMNPQNGVLADTLKSHVNLHLNLLDTKMGREFFVSKWLTLHPSAGFKSGWVNQNWQTKATGDVSALGLTSVIEYKIDMKQKFWGIGPMLGLDSEWGLISNFNFYANGSVALLTGFFNDYRNDTAVQRGRPNVMNSFKRKSHQPQWVSELQLGFRWNQWMGRDRYRLALQAGWDAIFFNDHNHLFSIGGGGASTAQTGQLTEANGDLMSQGVSMGVRLDF